MKRITLILILFLVVFTTQGFAKEISVDLNFLLQRGAFLYPDIKKKYHELRLAYLRAEEVAYERYPTLDATIYFNYLPFIYKQNDPSQPNLNGIKFDFSNWSPYFNPTATLVVPIYSFGKISNGEKAAQYNIELKKAELEETESAVKYEIKRIFWSYYHVRYISEFILSDVVEEYEKTVPEKEKDFNEGKISRKTFEDYKIDYFNWKRNELELERSTKELLYWLKLISGTSEEDQLKLPDTANLKPLTFDLKPYSFYSDLAKRYNYALKKSNFGYLARKYYYDYQQSNLLPDIFFGTSMSYVYHKFKDTVNASGVTTKDSLIPDSGFTIIFGFGIRWNLSFKKLTQKEQNKENFMNDLENIKIADQFQEIELRKSYDNLLEKKKRLDLSQEQFKASKRSLIFSINAYKTGTGNKDEYLNAIVTLYYRKRDYYQCIYDFNLGIASFEKMLGIDLVNYRDIFKDSIKYEEFEEDSQKKEEK